MIYLSFCFEFLLFVVEYNILIRMKYYLFKIMIFLSVSFNLGFAFFYLFYGRIVYKYKIVIISILEFYVNSLENKITRK